MANVQGFKVSLRSEIRAMMKKMSVAFVEEQSSLIFENVRRQDFYKKVCVSVFLSISHGNSNLVFRETVF